MPVDNERIYICRKIKGKIVQSFWYEILDNMPIYSKSVYKKIIMHIIIYNKFFQKTKTHPGNNWGHHVAKKRGGRISLLLLIFPPSNAFLLYVVILCKLLPSLTATVDPRHWSAWVGNNNKVFIVFCFMLSRLTSHSCLPIPANCLYSYIYACQGKNRTKFLVRNAWRYADLLKTYLWKNHYAHHLGT